MQIASRKITHQNLSLHPLSFVRGGYIHLWLGSLPFLGFDNDYWSIVAQSSASYAYNQGFYGANVYPSTSVYRAYGFSVRRERGNRNLHKLNILC